MNPITFPIVELVHNRYGKATDTKDAVIEVRVYYNKKTKWRCPRVFAFSSTSGAIVM